MVVIYCYLEREKYKVLKFNWNNSSYFKTSASPLKRPPVNKRRKYPKALKLNKHWGSLLEGKLYLRLV